MASLTAQRDLVIIYKKETLLNIGTLSKVQPMPTELSRQVFNDNALEKPTQNVFNHLAYYLVSIIDPTASSALPWPLYDSKTEKTYRTQLSAFITDYSSKGLLAPVMSSYLVNPGCFKVTFLIFQLSQLAVKNLLGRKMHNESKKKLYTDMTEQYKSLKDVGFIEEMDKHTEIVCSKFTNYLRSRKVIENTAEILRNKITHMEDVLENLKAQEMIDNLVNGFVKKHATTLDEDAKNKIMKLKNIHETPQIVEDWLTNLDDQLDRMEKTWDEKMLPFISICQKTVENSETLIARQTGEADRKTFALEYNPKSDEICTKKLQTVVNTQQQYILKNIIINDKLNFPNLIKGFLISVCYLLKNTTVDSEIAIFNEYLNAGRANYTEVVMAMKNLLERVMNAECSLSPSLQNINNHSASFHELTVIPPLPDLSSLKMNQGTPQLHYNFTPLNLTKHKFNLQRRNATNSFTKPLPKMQSLITPFHHNTERQNFFKSVISSRTNAYNQNMSINLNNLSTISHISKANETVAECNTGFTQQQIFRLLSTKKSTSSRKFKKKVNRPNIHIVKGGLFNESTLSNETGMYRCHSSPSLLFDVQDKRSKAKSKARRLSIMKEGSPSLLEVSGIAALDRNSNQSTPQSDFSLITLGNAKSLPGIAVTDTSGYVSNEKDDLNILNKEIHNSILEDKPTEPAVIIDYETTDKITKKTNGDIQADLCIDALNDIKHKSSTTLKPKRTQASHIPVRRTENQVTENCNLETRSMDYLMLPCKSAKNASSKVTQTLSTQSQSQPTRKSTENLQIARKSTENVQIARNSTENIKVPRKSTENVQITRKSTDAQTTKNTEVARKSTDQQNIENSGTPTTKPQLIKKTSSIEKIINRFKKIRASVLPDFNANMEDTSDFKTIVEEKENINFNIGTVNIDDFMANRVLLPDLLSPSCSILSANPVDLKQLGFNSDEDEIRPRKPRESLGTMLGVDQSILDPMDWID